MKKYRRAAILVTVLLVLMMAAADRSTYRYQLAGVSDTAWQEDTLYILDNQGDSYQLFAAERNGRIKGRISLPKLVGDWWNTYSSLSVDRDGQVYLYSYGKTMDLGVTKSQVFLCDFEQEVLIPKWELPPIKMIQTQVSHGAVYYLVEEHGGKAGFYRQGPDGQEECLLKPDADYAQVKGFGWHPDAGVLWVDWNGFFYQNGERIENGAGDKRDYVDICADENGIAFTDMKTGDVMFLDWTSGKPRPMFQIKDVTMMQENLEYLDLLPLHYDRKDGSWGAGVDIGPEYRCLGLFDAEGSQILQLEVLEKPVWDRILYAAKAGCLFLVILTAAAALAKRLLLHTKGTVPILIQLLAVLIPLIVLSYGFLDHQIRQSLEKRLLKMEYDSLYVDADHVLSRMNPEELTRIDLWDVPRDARYRRLFEQQDYSTLEKSIYSPDGQKGEPVISNVYTWMFMEQEGELRYLYVTDRHYYGMRVEYDRGKTEVEKMRRAMEGQHIVKSEYNDFAGTFVVLYIPIIDDNGKSVGVMECGLNRRILTYEIKRQMDWIHGLLGGVSLLLMLLILLVLRFFLRPLGVVREAVEDVSGGNLGRVVPVRGRDEVAGISRAFNQMSCQLKEQVEFIRLCSERYAAFVPKKVFEILEREDITQVELGDQKEIMAAILDIGSSQFPVMAKQMNGEALYGMINLVLREMIPIVTAQEGVIEHMAGEELAAYYPGGSRQSLLSAISICEKMNGLSAQGEHIPLYRAVIHAGLIRVGIVGRQERMAAATISEVMTLSAFLRETGETYGARILITESAVKQIPDFSERFHARMIGYLHLHMSQSLEAVYDVYDGDVDGQRKRKEETNELFGQALKDYLSCQYYDARLKFAKILRRNPQDLAARAYVYRCDAYCQSDGSQNLEVWLEQY